MRAEEAERQAMPAPPPRYNPYLAHMEGNEVEEDDEEDDEGYDASVAPMRKRQR